MRFPDLLTITIRSDLSSVTDSISKISGLDRDMFTLVKAEVPNFRDHFWFSLEIFSLTSLSYILFHTWLYPLFYLLLSFLHFLTKKNLEIKFPNLIFLTSTYRLIFHISTSPLGACGSCLARIFNCKRINAGVGGMLKCIDGTSSGADTINIGVNVMTAGADAMTMGVDRK